jgi:hypothetical protein
MTMGKRGVSIVAVLSGSLIVAGALLTAALERRNAARAGQDTAPPGAKPANTDPSEAPKLGAMPPPPSIKPPLMDKAMRAVPLNDTIGDVAIGGAGRFLVLHLIKGRKLALFDVNEAKVVHEFKADDETVKFAAGLDKLVIVRGGDTVERWDLLTRKREWSAPALPGARVARAACMGSASRGPVLVQWADDDKNETAPAPVEFLDLESLQPLVLRLMNGPSATRSFVLRDRIHFRASADGSVFGAWGSFMPTGAYSYVVADKKIHTYYRHESYGSVLPGPDGKILYTGAGEFTTEFKKSRAGRGLSAPAHRGPYYLRANVGPLDGTRDKFGQPEYKVSGFTAYRMADHQALLTDPSISLTMDVVQLSHGVPDLDQRIHLIPDAQLIITIPPSNDQLILHRFDLSKAEKKNEQ